MYAQNAPPSANEKASKNPAGLSAIPVAIAVSTYVCGEAPVTVVNPSITTCGFKAPAIHMAKKVMVIAAGM